LILAMLARGWGLVIWLLMIMLSFFGTALAGRLLFDRESTPFCLEIPPLRLPRPGAILRKTAARLCWYLREILPLFIGISILMWALHQTGLVDHLINGLRPMVAALGLPGETALVFVYGFLRRDYGAAGLFDLSRAGLLGQGQVLTAAVVLTLFLPCIAQLTVLFKEHGAGFALLVVTMTALTAWLAGMVVYFLTGIPLIAGLLG
jgi:ferrous iron transport protein B